MSTPVTDPVLIDLSKHPGVVAVVGLSADPGKPSYGVAAYMIAHGVTIHPVNPTYAGQEILGRTVYGSLAEVPEHIHIVDIFRRPEYILPIIEEAITAKADAVWLQLGIINAEAVERARAAGLGAVQDRCLKIEYARYADRG